jgi:peptidoglycan-associated lipoprotein
LGAVGALIVVVGCKPDYPTCKKDKHCHVEAGEKCVEGLCQNCTTAEDCVGKGPGGENWVCHEFRCMDPAQVPGAGTGAGTQGSPCAASTDCGGGLVCKAGICDACVADAECGTGTCDLDVGRCSDGAAGGGSCSTDDDCAMDEICDAGACVFSGGYGDGTVLCDLQAVYFDFDSPELGPETQQALENAAACLAQQNRLVYLEAHADARGTEEYNILLTDRRGQSVRAFLEQRGVAGDKMQVISKGSLEATGTDDAGWAKDRRVELVWP